MLGKNNTYNTMLQLLQGKPSYSTLECVLNFITEELHFSICMKIRNEIFQTDGCSNLLIFICDLYVSSLVQMSFVACSNSTPIFANMMCVFRVSSWCLLAIILTGFMEFALCSFSFQKRTFETFYYAPEITDFQRCWDLGQLSFQFRGNFLLKIRCALNLNWMIHQIGTFTTTKHGEHSK